MNRMTKVFLALAALAMIAVSPIANANEPSKASKAPAPAAAQAAPQAAQTDTYTSKTTTTTTEVTASAQNAKSAKSSDIVATATSNGNFKTLTSLLQTAGLVDTLKGPGPFTVFAPTDAAFAKLPAGTLEDLSKPENKAKLRSILTYHVVPGKLSTTDFSGKQLSQNTVEGTALSINGSTPSAITVGSAKIQGSEVAASNGTIYSIDTVLMPQEASKKSM